MSEDVKDRPSCRYEYTSKFRKFSVVEHNVEMGAKWFFKFVLMFRLLQYGLQPNVPLD
jgi:hypothetical protein